MHSYLFSLTVCVYQLLREDLTRCYCFFKGLNDESVIKIACDYLSVDTLNLVDSPLID